MTTFAMPFASGGTNSIGYKASTTNTDNIIGVRCTSDSCTLQITGLSQDTYHLRISSIYRDVSLQVSATNTSGGAVELKNAQAVIDSTGKAQDVLRRIQVNVPYGTSSKNALSDYAIKSTDSICKRYSVMTGFFQNNVSGVTSDNRLCN